MSQSKRLADSFNSVDRSTADGMADKIAALRAGGPDVLEELRRDMERSTGVPVTKDLLVRAINMAGTLMQGRAMGADIEPQDVERIAGAVMGVPDPTDLKSVVRRRVLSGVMDNMPVKIVHRLRKAAKEFLDDPGAADEITALAKSIGLEDDSRDTLRERAQFIHDVATERLHGAH